MLGLSDLSTRPRGNSQAAKDTKSRITWGGSIRLRDDHFNRFGWNRPNDCGDFFAGTISKAPIAGGNPVRSTLFLE